MEALQPMMIDDASASNDSDIKTIFNWWKTQLSDYEFIKSLFLYSLVGLFAISVVYYMFPSPSSVLIKSELTIKDAVSFSTVSDLREHIHSASHRAKASKALSTIPITSSTAEYGGVEFVFCRPSQAAKQSYNQISTPKTGSFDALALDTMDEDLIVHRFSEASSDAWRYSLVLNKFNTIADHCLLLSNSMLPQSLPLTREEFILWFWSIAKTNGVGFFNANKLAGASQPHRHLQLVPGDSLWSLRSPDSAHATLLDDFILNQRDAKHWEALPLSLATRRSMKSWVHQIPTFSFRHAVVLLDRGFLDSREDEAARSSAFGDYLMRAYRLLLESVGLEEATLRDCALGSGDSAGLPAGADCLSYGAYNLVLTQDYMAIFPRRAAPPFDAMNSFVFLGLIMINNDETESVLRDGGPLALIDKITIQ